MTQAARYDTIGSTYARTRTTEPRIAARIHAALGGARTVCNLGCGTGSYEPTDRVVVGLDPSRTMLAQRPVGPNPAVLGAAEALPFRDRAFDAAMATLTLHHWSDLEAGVAEMRRVAERQVVLFFDVPSAPALWLIDDYFPEIVELPSERAAPDAARLATLFEVVSIDPVPVPADCVDGFAGCYWNRPEAYLDADVQAGMSSLAQLAPAVRAAGTERLRAELANGEWDRKYGGLRALDEYDLGYRILVAVG